MHHRHDHLGAASAVLGIALALASSARGQDCTAHGPLMSPLRVEMNYLGALDARLHDFDLDGDLDILYFGTQQPHVVPHDAVQLCINELPCCGPLPLAEALLVTDPSAHFSLDPQGIIDELNADDVEADNSDATQGWGTYDVVIADFDNNGYDDVVVARLGYRDYVYLADPPTGGGPPVFRAGFPIGPEQSQYAYCADGTDARAGEAGAGNVIRHPRPGQGTLCDRRWSTGAYASFVDDDAFLDLVLVYRDAQPHVWLNDGTGAFLLGEVLPAPPHEIAGNPYPGNGGRDVYFADFDGDGDDDLIVARHARRSHNGTLAIGMQSLYRNCIVYRNMRIDLVAPATSAPFFTYWYNLDPWEPVLDGDFDGVDVPDLSGDEGDDVSIQSGSLQITVCDLDGDGDVDVIQPIAGDGQNTKGLSAATRIYLNDGSGQLGRGAEGASHRPSFCIGATASLEHLGLGLQQAAHAAVADMDCDGDLDIALAHHAAEPGLTIVPDMLWLQCPQTEIVPPFGSIPVFEPSGDGIEPNFDCGSLSPGEPCVDSTRYIRFGDLDRDGDPDWFEGNFLTPDNNGPVKSRIIFNHNDCCVIINGMLVCYGQQ